VEGAQGEPLVSGELDLGQTALPEAGQQLSDFNGAAMAPIRAGMPHAGDSADRVYSAVDAVVGAHTLLERESPTAHTAADSAGS
jgi:hypothetical protein